MANYFKIKHGFISTGDGSITGTLDVSAGININGDAVATQAWVNSLGLITSGSVSNNYLPLSGGTLTGTLTLSAVNPRIDFNGTSDSSVDMAIVATPEGLDFIEPEQGSRIQFQIKDDAGVNAPYGYAWNGQSLDDRYAAAAHTHAYNTLTGIPNTFTPSAHTHPIDEIDGLQDQLDGKQPAGNYLTSLPSHNHDDRYVKLSGSTMGGDITWTTSGKGLQWTMNTDGAGIKFYNTGDGDTNSRLEYFTTDNGNEFHRFLVSGDEEMTIKTDGVRVNTDLYIGGNRAATQVWVSTRGYLTALPTDAEFRDLTTVGVAKFAGPINNSQPEVPAVYIGVSGGNDPQIQLQGDGYNPHIDFAGSPDVDYDARIILTSANNLDVVGADLRIGSNKVATETWVTGRGYLTSLPSHNHDDRYLVKGGSWNGVNMPGSRWGGFSVNGGEVAFQRDNPNNGQMSVMVDGNFYAGERNGFWSLYSNSPSHNNYNEKVGFYSNASGHFLISTSAVYAGGNQVWHAGNFTPGDKLNATHDMTLTLSGDASGSATFTNMGNATLSVTVANDSHTHDGRYYTESESDARFVNVTGDTITGDLHISGASLGVTSTTQGTEAFYVDGVNGRLFTISDDLSDSLFSVNTISGLPVIEAFADNTVKIGPFSNPVTIDSSGVLAIGGVTAATETYVDTAITNLIGGAPGALDTLNELAAAINDNASYASSVTSALALKAPLASPALTGNPTAPTQATSNNSTRIATTAFVKAQGYVTTDTNYYLNGISRSGNVLTFSVAGATNQTYTFGSAAWSATSAFDAAGSADAVNTRIEEEVLPLFANYQPAGNYFTDGDTVLNMANNDGLVFNDSNNLMYIKADGTNYAIIDSRGGSVNGTLSITGGNHIAMSNGNITGVNQITINDPGEGIIWSAGSSGDITLAVTDDASDNILNLSGTGASLAVNGATVATQAWVNAQGFTTSTGSNYYLSGASFSTSNGVLTLTVTGSSNVTVDLDGRFALGSDLADVNDRIDNEVLPIIQTPAITSNGSAPSLTSGITASEVRSLINAEENNTTLPLSGGTLTGDLIIGDTAWINHDNQNVFNNYNENIRLRNAGNGVSVIAFGAEGTGGVPASSILSYGDRHEIRRGNAWKQRTRDASIDFSVQLNVTGHGNSSQWNTAYGWGNHANAGYLTSYSETDTLQSVTDRGSTTTNSITVANIIASRGYFGSTGTNPQINIFTENATASIADTFTDTTTDKSYIYFNAGTGSNDPAYIMHETSEDASPDERNEGVLHLVPSDDNSFGDYVSIHGTNDPDCIKLHTNGTIETSSSYQLTLISGSGSVRIDDALSVANQINTDSHGDSSQWNTAYSWGDHAAAGYQPAGTYNTIIGTDSDINTSGATIIDNIYVTDGVITSMGTRTLTQADLGIPTNTSGNWWNGGYAAVGTDGVMEVGKYIDFHDTDTQSSDFSYRITNTGGRLYFSGDLELDGGDLYLNDGNTRLHEAGGNALKVSTNSGYIELGPMNTGHCHIQTDRTNFYFNKQIQVDTGKVSSYNEDLYLQRAGSTKITVGSTITTFANLISIPKPTAVQDLQLTVVNDTINVTFNESPTTADNYLVFSSVGGGDYGLISVLSPEDMSASMSVIDTTFSTSGTIAYRVYAVKNGVYSEPAEASITFSTPSEDVGNLSSVSLNVAYYVQWEAPANYGRFVDEYRIYADVKDTSGSLNRNDASLVYQGVNTNYMYAVSGSNFDKFHQFWVEVIYR